MKAVVRYEDGAGKLEVRDVPVPEISDGDVLLRVMAAGLCGSDVNTYKGRSVFRGPVIIGHEFAGVVEKVGSRVTAWKAGDRVVSDNTGDVCGTCHACIRGEYLWCPNRKGLGGGIDGGFAEYVRIPEHVLNTYPACLMRIPDNVSFEEAAILDPACNGYNACIQQGGMMPGDSVAVFGAGPLSLGAISAAKAGGAVDIICLVRKSTSKAHRDVALKLGATHILESNSDDAVSEVKRITDGEGVALVLDGAGPNGLFPISVDIVRNGGKIVRIGYDWEPLGYSLNTMTNRNISIIGHMGYNPTSWKQVLKLLSAGMIDLKSTITHTLPLTDFDRGMELMINREAIKVVFKP